MGSVFIHWILQGLVFIFRQTTRQKRSKYTHTHTGMYIDRAVGPIGRSTNGFFGLARTFGRRHWQAPVSIIRTAAKTSSLFFYPFFLLLLLLFWLLHTSPSRLVCVVKDGNLSVRHSFCGQSRLTFFLRIKLPLGNSRKRMLNRRYGVTRVEKSSANRYFRLVWRQGPDVWRSQSDENKFKLFFFLLLLSF
jgi:hypothetical protein